MFGIVSPRIVGTLARCPFVWAFFYAQVFVLLAVCGAAIVFVAGDNARTALWFSPLFVAVMILACRLLGRLAWYLSEKLATVEPVSDEPHPATKIYNPPRPSKKKAT
jgi:hypothetical protein